MKIKHILSIAVIVLVGFIAVNANNQGGTEGISFYHGTFDQAKAQAKKENKLIFIDAYTTWCGPCKMMAKKIFTQKTVGDYYNPNFINLKIDMEGSEGLYLSKKYKVSGYPTFLFVNSEGQLVTKEMGMVSAPTFIGYGKRAIKGKK
jgi:thiol:disulfide interchange protein